VTAFAPPQQATRRPTINKERKCMAGNRTSRRGGIGGGRTRQGLHCTSPDRALASAQAKSEAATHETRRTSAPLDRNSRRRQRSGQLTCGCKANGRRRAYRRRGLGGRLPWRRRRSDEGRRRSDEGRRWPSRYIIKGGTRGMVTAPWRRSMVQPARGHHVAVGRQRSELCRSRRQSEPS